MGWGSGFGDPPAAGCVLEQVLRETKARIVRIVLVGNMEQILLVEMDIRRGGIAGVSLGRHSCHGSLQVVDLEAVEGNLQRCS